MRAWLGPTRNTTNKRRVLENDYVIIELYDSNVNDEILFLNNAGSPKRPFIMATRPRITSQIVRTR